MTEHNWPGDDGHHDDGSAPDGAGHDGTGHDGTGHDGADGGHPGALHDAEPYPSWRDPHDVDGPPWDSDAPWHQDPWQQDPHDAGPPADHPGGDTAQADTAPDDTGPDDTGPDDTGGYAMGHVGADPDALPDVDAVADPDAFAPPVDVGALPEPVDGFPWVDPATLGAPSPIAPGAAAVGAAAAPVDSTELAAYAGQDPHADWRDLAASDDPAVAALARFWRPTG